MRKHGKRFIANFTFVVATAVVAGLVSPVSRMLLLIKSL